MGELDEYPVFRGRIQLSRELFERRQGPQAAPGNSDKLHTVTEFRKFVRQPIRVILYTVTGAILPTQDDGNIQSMITPWDQQRGSSVLWTSALGELGPPPKPRNPLVRRTW